LNTPQTESDSKYGDVHGKGINASASDEIQQFEGIILENFDYISYK
jgi:hypothetical protein